MTRLSLLEDQKAILEAKKAELENKRGDIYVREQQAITDTILPFFNQFTPEVEIEVTRGSVYFKMAHPDYSYKKELFNIYLVENWTFDGVENKKSFARVDLSYYTTSTKGIDKWELKRLQLLGAVAEIVLEHQDRILDRVNHVVLPFKDEYDVVFKELQEVGKEIGGVEQLITFLEKEKIEWDLKDEGVTFKNGRNIQLKWNYSPNVIWIKLTDVSKSGKTCTAVFKWAHGGNESREEKVNVESIIDQVYGLRNDIVQHTLAE
jgi:hypothetical protein